MVKKTVSTLSMSRGSSNEVYLQVEDYHSGDRIMEMTLSLADVGALITGVGDVKVFTEYYGDTAEIACEREVKTVMCDKIYEVGDKVKQKAEVLKNFNSVWKEDGWVIHSDGTTSQQRDDHHTYTIKRYVDLPEEEVLKPLSRKRY